MCSTPTHLAKPPVPEGLADPKVLPPAELPKVGAEPNVAPLPNAGCPPNAAPDPNLGAPPNAGPPNEGGLPNPPPPRNEKSHYRQVKLQLYFKIIYFVSMVFTIGSTH